MKASQKYRMQIEHKNRTKCSPKKPNWSQIYVISQRNILWTNWAIFIWPQTSQSLDVWSHKCAGNLSPSLVHLVLYYKSKNDYHVSSTTTYRRCFERVKGEIDMKTVYAWSIRYKTMTIHKYIFIDLPNFVTFSTEIRFNEIK